MDNDAHGLFKGPMTPAEAWLGTRTDKWATERFPDGTLNEKQLRELLSIEEGSKHVVELDLNPALLQITDDITEIHTRFGHSRGSFNADRVVFWISTEGKYIAGVQEIYKGPQGVHKPGDTFTKTAKGYYRSPDMAMFTKPVERDYPQGLWTLGNQGAIQQARLYLRAVWVERTVTVSQYFTNLDNQEGNA